VLDRELLRQLQTPEGQSALETALQAAPNEASFLAESQRLARRVPERLARAAVEQAILRRRAREKFAQADRMYFLREALEQATAEPVARHRARRFAGAGWIADLGCGIGGDALALASAGPVLAVDRDPLRLAVLQANAQALKVSAVLPIVADVFDRPWRRLREGLAFADPTRRSAGRRTRSGARSDPPLPRLMTVLEEFEGWAVKLSPAVDRAEVSRLGAELEFVSLDGDLKEATLWGGRLRTSVRRATILPEGAELTGDAEPEVEVGPLETYLLVPDPAVRRAYLVRTLAVSLGAHLIDPDIGLLTSAATVETPFARTFRVLEVLPAGPRALRQGLKARGFGQVTLMKRGSSVDTDEFGKRLRMGEGREAIVLLTRARGRHVALLLKTVTEDPWQDRSDP
jgi:SAM-dependent methyltransferase